MEKEYVIISEYCQKCGLDPSFLVLLEDEGLIEVQLIEGRKYIHSTQLSELERCTRMYYDLSINIEGIDAIRHLLGRIRVLQEEVSDLRKRLRFFDSDFFEEEI